MVVTDIDIWRVANLLIKRHGADAGTIAAQRADELLAKGDHEGGLVWKRILAAIEEWHRDQPPEGESVN